MMLVNDFILSDWGYLIAGICVYGSCLVMSLSMIVWGLIRS